MIISFSGIDSAGKSTQIDMLLEYCISHGIKSRKIWGKARGTPGVILLKELFRRDRGMSLDDKLKYREQIYRSTVGKRLLLFISLVDLCWYFGVYYRLLNFRYDLVICDRYIWDTYVEIKNEFQDIDVDCWIVWKLVKFLSPMPSVSFMMIIPVEESIRRDINKMDLTVDSKELKNSKIKLYLDLLREGKWKTVLDGMSDKFAIHQRVIKELGFEN